MANKYLARDDAPFGSDVWDVLDNTMIDIAKNRLTGRRLLPLDGPYGFGLKSIPLWDMEAEDGLTVSENLPVVLIQKEFGLGARDLANFERDHHYLDVEPVEQAVRACVEREDDLIFNGGAGLPGLMNLLGASNLTLSDWDKIGTAAQDIIQAITSLDAAGFHGPYTMALAPQRYNLLFRRYHNGNQSELEHLRTMVTDGIVKAPLLEEGGVILEANHRNMALVLGQDMTIGFIGPAGDTVEFTLSESLTLRVRHPKAVCILEA